MCLLHVSDVTPRSIIWRVSILLKTYSQHYKID